MGGITKRPKAPKIKTFVPTLNPVPTPVPVVEEKEQGDTVSREQSLLRRSRGRFGTILTGFRGFLNPKNSDNKPNRKTLLGE